MLCPGFQDHSQIQWFNRSPHRTMAKVISAKAATQDQQKKKVQTVKVQMKPGTNFQSPLSVDPTKRVQSPQHHTAMISFKGCPPGKFIRDLVSRDFSEGWTHRLSSTQHVPQFLLSRMKAGAHHLPEHSGQERRLTELLCLSGNAGDIPVTHLQRPAKGQPH